MNQWIKYYADGTKYIGTDSDTNKGLASWRKSSNSNIIQVDLEHQNYLIRICGPGEYWQSDGYETLYLISGQSNLTYRRIERKIESSDRFFRVDSRSRSMVIFFGSQVNGGNGYIIPIKSDQINKWFILELDVKMNHAKYYFSDGQI